MKYKTIFIGMFFLSMFFCDGLLFSYDSTLNTYGAKHKMEHRGMDGELIIIEDGSIWTIHPKYRDQVSLWEEGSDVEMHCNESHSFWDGSKKCSYKVIHVQSGQKALVEIFSEPGLENPHRRTITRIKTVQSPYITAQSPYIIGRVCLSDGTMWHANNSHYSPGDTVIVMKYHSDRVAHFRNLDTITYNNLVGRYAFFNLENGVASEVYPPLRSCLNGSISGIVVR